MLKHCQDQIVSQGSFHGDKAVVVRHLLNPVESSSNSQTDQIPIVRASTLCILCTFDQYIDAKALYLTNAELLIDGKKDTIVARHSGPDE